MAKWDPAQYERYKTYRDRPALDLLVQIPQDLEPDEIWDLGCGTGEHAALLARRHPGAKVYGLDSSPDMLVDARARTAPVTWIEDSIANFAPKSAPDLIFTNSALQWLPDHANLFPRLVSTLAPGGVFACQVPQSHNTLWHQQLRDTAAEAPWADRLQGLDTVQPVASPEAYHDWLTPLAEVDIWSTVYLHVLTGEDPVVDWMKGTGLRPYLTALADDPATRDAFLASYSAKVARDFPMRADGSTLFPFPRLFIIARRR
jgi:trans-aconitate 2-methyltransferase